MGLLDDAIREHLDLKRRRGADAGEVARQENEALGPVRREPVPESGGAAAPADGVADAPVDDDATRMMDVAPASVPVEVTETKEDDAGGAYRASDPPADTARGVAGPDASSEWGFDDVPEEEPVAEEEQEEDVLEETPDFLQETPEHDRLWFEQKPPRDFRFD